MCWIWQSRKCFLPAKGTQHMFMKRWVWCAENRYQLLYHTHGDNCVCRKEETDTYVRPETNGSPRICSGKKPLHTNSATVTYYFHLKTALLSLLCFIHCIFTLFTGLMQLFPTSKSNLSHGEQWSNPNLNLTAHTVKALLPSSLQILGTVKTTLQNEAHI